MLHYQRLAVSLFLLAALLIANAVLYPKATGGDFCAPWVGTRFFLRGEDPYGTTATRATQSIIYGHVLMPLEIAGHRDQQRFAYPLYVAFLVGPVSGMEFPGARHAVWITLAVCTLLSVFLWADAMSWTPPLFVLGAFAAIVLFSPLAQRALALTQLALLVMFLLALVGRCIVHGRFMLAGAALGFATIKPQMAALFVLWLLVWIFSDWKRRKRLGLSFALTMCALVGTSSFLQPSWVREFILGLSAYRGYTGAPSALEAVHLSVIAPPLLAALVALMWHSRRAEADSSAFAATSAATLAITAWAMPAMFDPFNQLLLIPAVCLLGNRFRTRRLRFPFRGPVAIYSLVARRNSHEECQAVRTNR